MSGEPEFIPLSPADLAPLSTLLEAQRHEYIQHFRPFRFDVATLSAQLDAAKLDQFWTIRMEGVLAGFFMLRGWDAGYSRPAFGVFVAEAFTRRKLARRALDFSINYCRNAGVCAVMLTVHPSNQTALRVYEAAGFKPTGERSKTGDHILELYL